MGVKAKENLSTGVTMVKTLTVGKNGICRDSFIKSVGVQMGYSGLDVLSHGVFNDHFGQLGSLCQGSLDDLHRSIAQVWL